MTRPSWTDQHFAKARLLAERGTCGRLRVGAVIVRDNRTIAEGYNGALPGQDHCDTVGCRVVEGSCIRAVHAEENAIAMAARFGIWVEGADLYSTHKPCWRCERLLVAAGIRRIKYETEYESASHPSGEPVTERISK